MSRYTNIDKRLKNNVVRIGTSYLPTFKESNSDTLLIASEYYGTTDLWWFIASVNNLSSNNIEAGTQLRMPVSTEQAFLK